MNNRHKTDLEIAEDLELLRQTVDEALGKLSSILEQLERTEKRLNKSFGDSEHLLNLLKELKKIIPNQDVLARIQGFLDEAKQILHDLQTNWQKLEENKQFIRSTEENVKAILEQTSEALNETKTQHQKIEQSRQLIQDTENQIKKILVEAEPLLNLLRRLDEVVTNGNVSEHIRVILDEITQCQSCLEQTVHELQTNRQRLEEDKQFIQNTESNTRELLDQTAKILEEIKTQQQRAEHNKQLIQSAEDNTKHILQQVNKALEDLQANQQKLAEDKQFIQNTESNTRELLMQINSAINELKTNQVRVEQDKKFIIDTEARIKQTLEQAEKILAELASVRDLPNKFRELGDSIVCRINELSEQSISLSRQLDECKQATFVLQDFENHLREFREYRSRRQLRSFLYRELGFAGLVVYILHLILPKRRK